MKKDYKTLLEILPSSGIIIIGEIHGTKETPKIFTNLVNDLAKLKDFTVCVEVPEENQLYFNRFLDLNEERFLSVAPFFKNNVETDGRNSREFFGMIKEISKINKKRKSHIDIICIDSNKWYSQDQREEELAKNIIKSHKKEITLVLIGNIHAMKKPFFINGMSIEPMAYKLKEQYKKKVFSVALLPEKGKYFNCGEKLVSGISVDNLYDYIFKIPVVHPCTFMKNIKEKS